MIHRGCTGSRTSDTHALTHALPGLTFTYSLFVSGEAKPQLSIMAGTDPSIPGTAQCLWPLPSALAAALNQAPVDGPDTAQKGLVRAMRCVCFHQYINCSNTQTNHKLKSDCARWVATQSRARRHPQAIAPNDALTG